ncbi:hypothetical protein GCM10010156_05950 [Planobispora rosea]|uniref:Polyketide cyclase/dehydrase n=1 Tax=Planobispora rosea TaxID=35762 RepID=A0A8J3RZ45_PLARO|nr:SRPBCC family protein [Planobispora rosea]GGS50044.1 hypothetical protein GCM10010156_05950 [Planobispora rosea]GIH83879.1 hypothetical protein Pro02_22870 [Planobispora rosea]
MRYQDGPAVEHEIHIRAEQERVWSLVTDIDVPARFSPELRGVRWLGQTDRPAVDACFEGRNRNAILGEWRTVSYVTELDPPHTFAWAVVDPDGRFGGDAPDPRVPMAVWRFGLRPGAGGTLLRQSVRLGPARSGLSLAIDRMPDKEESLVRHRLADLLSGIQATLQGIKTLAEQSR